MKIREKHVKQVLYRWECECGATGWMNPGMRGKFLDTSLAGLVRQARSIHECADPDIIGLDTKEDWDRKQYVASQPTAEQLGEGFC